MAAMRVIPNLAVYRPCDAVETAECWQLALKDEIANAGGNVQPIQVRAIQGAPRVFDGQTPTHEIVYGHRRHQARRCGPRLWARCARRRAGSAASRRRLR